MFIIYQRLIPTPTIFHRRNMANDTGNNVVTFTRQPMISMPPFWMWLVHVAVCQNLVPLVNIKIAGKWMFIPLKMVLIGIDPYPCILLFYSHALAPTYRETQIDTSFLTFWNQVVVFRKDNAVQSLVLWQSWEQAFDPARVINVPWHWKKQIPWMILASYHLVI